MPPKAFLIKSSADFNERARGIFLAAMDHYGISLLAWAKANRKSYATLNKWVNGKKDASIEYAAEVLAICGCKMWVEPPPGFRPVRRRFRKPKGQAW